MAQLRSDGSQYRFNLRRTGFVLKRSELEGRTVNQLGRQILRTYGVYPWYDSLTGCWRWPLSLNSHGYGAWWWNNSAVGAHRWLYQQVYRTTLPRTLVVDHVNRRRCMYRDCVRPSHLEAVTVAENIRRGKWPTVVRDLKLRGELKAA